MTSRTSCNYHCTNEKIFRGAICTTVNQNLHVIETTNPCTVQDQKNNSDVYCPCDIIIQSVVNVYKEAFVNSGTNISQLSRKQGGVVFRSSKMEAEDIYDSCHTYAFR